MARRIADHLALAVSHEQLAGLAREAAEAKLGADRLEARGRSLSDEVTAKAGRVVGPSEAWQPMLKAAAQVASTDTTVIVGESGTGCGKSLIGSAFVGVGVRQHPRPESISKCAPSIAAQAVRTRVQIVSRRASADKYLFFQWLRKRDLRGHVTNSI